MQSKEHVKVGHQKIIIEPEGRKVVEVSSQKSKTKRERSEDEAVVNQHVPTEEEELQ